MNDNSQKNFIDVEDEIKRINDRIEEIEDRVFKHSQANLKEQNCKIFERQYSESHLIRIDKLNQESDRYEASFSKEKDELWNKRETLKGLK